ncbi:MAG: hypothetical protein JOZ46_01335 [Candidatus Dormibacteraeota bacterium]|nr:hypothetical protein [Candidatus Dormibacteraeota bacterium]MBV9524437.1 hypothetical protein [Candidatus Dormibacteraeota bacterium]
MPIEEPYGMQILTGWKRYEIRTQELHAAEGARIWVYATAGSRESGKGAVLGFFVFGGAFPFTEEELHWKAGEAAATVERLNRYLRGRPAWGLKVRYYRRFKHPLNGTISGQGIRHLTNQTLLARLKKQPMFKMRRPQARWAMVQHTKKTVSWPDLTVATEGLLQPLLAAGWTLRKQAQDDRYPPYCFISNFISRGGLRLELERADDGTVTVWRNVRSANPDNPPPPLVTTIGDEKALRAFKRNGWL